MPLGDLTTLISSGSTPKGGSEVYLRQGPVMLIRSQNVRMNTLVLDDVAYVTDEIDAQMVRSRVKFGDVLLNITGASIGRVATFDLEHVEANVNQHVCIIRPRPDALFGRYLSYLISNPEFQLHIDRLQHGGTRQALTFGQIAEFGIPLPPLPEQRRIAAILDKADGLRAKRRVIADRLGGMPDALFSELERSPDFAGWTKVSLRDAFWFQEGPGVRSSQFRPEGVKLLNVGNIEKNGTLNLSKTKRSISEEEFKTKYRHFAVDEGDFVIASSGISFDEDGFLRTRGAFVQAHHLPLCMNTSTIRFKAVKDKSNLRFLSGWLNSLSFRSQITRLVTGSAQQNFGPSHLETIRIALPPLRVQESLANKFATIDRLRESHDSSLATIGELFSTLQHQAFSGAL